MDCRGHNSPGRNRSCYEARTLSRIEIKRLTYNMALLINVTRQEQKGRTRHSQRVHVGQLGVLPQDRAEEVRPSSRQTYDLVALFINAVGRTAEIARDFAQGLDAARFGPDECFIDSCSARGRVGETDDRALIIDGCGRVPGIASDVPKIIRNTVLPKHRVFSANTSDRDSTIAGDADHLSEIIDCCRRTGAVAGQRWEFLHLAVRLPDRRPELQDLKGRVASCIVDTVLCPPDHLTAVIDAGGVAAIT